MQLHSFLYKSSETKTVNFETFGRDSIDIFLSEMKRDLENLLNTRRSPFSVSSEFKELSVSVLEYGVDDFSGHLGVSEGNIQKLAFDIEKTIRLYENRLNTVKVTPVKSAQDNKKLFLFKIEAQINLGGKVFSVFSHLNLHMRNQTYSFHDWSFGYDG